MEYDESAPGSAHNIYFWRLVRVSSCFNGALERLRMFKDSADSSVRLYLSYADLDCTRITQRGKCAKRRPFLSNEACSLLFELH